MNYHKLYQRIIDKRKSQGFEGYGEWHHILPRSLGGSDHPNNFVKLTAREHFICHYLLTKLYTRNSKEWYKMINAFLMMKCGTNKRRYFNSRLYESLRKDFSTMMSFSQKGERNSQYGVIWIYNEKYMISKTVDKSEFEELEKDGWKIGRKMVFNKPQKYRMCLYCEKEFNLVNNEKLCSDTCKFHHNRPHYKYDIDKNVETLINTYKKCQHIGKTLDTIGLDSSKREGNFYFSSILKERGVKVKRKGGKRKHT